MKYSYIIKSVGYNYNYDKLDQTLGLYPDKSKPQWLYSHDRLADVLEFETIDKAIQYLYEFLKNDLDGPLLAIESDNEFVIPLGVLRGSSVHLTSMKLKMVGFNHD